MDHMDIIESVISGKVLEIMHQTPHSTTAKAYLDGEEVSVSQAVRASRNNMLNIAAKASDWTAYTS